MWGYLLWMTHTPTASFICERFISQDDTVICPSLCFVFFDMKKAVVEAGAGLRGTEGGTDMWPDQSLQGPVRPLRSSCPGLHGHPEVQLDSVGQLPAAVGQWGPLTRFITSFMMKAWACDGEPTQHTCTYYYVIFVVTLQQCKTINPINTGYISNSTHHLAFNTTNIILNIFLVLWLFYQSSPWDRIRPPYPRHVTVRAITCTFLMIYLHLLLILLTALLNMNYRFYTVPWRFPLRTVSLVRNLFKVFLLT